MSEKEVIQKIQNYSYYKARLKEVQEQLASMAYKVTATYGNLAAATSNSFTSKVETYGNRKYELHKKEAAIKASIAEIERLINCSGLDSKESELMWWLANNGKLQAYARREHIGKFNVYKIRDRALRKIITANEPQSVVLKLQ